LRIILLALDVDILAIIGGLGKAPDKNIRRRKFSGEKPQTLPNACGLPNMN